MNQDASAGIFQKRAGKAAVPRRRASAGLFGISGRFQRFRPASLIFQPHPTGLFLLTASCHRLPPFPAALTTSRVCVAQAGGGDLPSGALAPHHPTLPAAPTVLPPPAASVLRRARLSPATGCLTRNFSAGFPRAEDFSFSRNFAPPCPPAVAPGQRASGGSAARPVAGAAGGPLAGSARKIGGLRFSSGNPGRSLVGSPGSPSLTGMPALGCNSRNGKRAKSR